MEIISKSPVPAAAAARHWSAAASLGRPPGAPARHAPQGQLGHAQSPDNGAPAGRPGGALAFTPGTWGWTNLAALLVIVSNFLDHTDGELARISGKTSRIGHLYDLASDALVTILLFCCIGVGVAASAHAAMPFGIPAGARGRRGRRAVALIFYLRMRIEELLGKSGTRQSSLAGFETEDVLYLLPLVTLFGGLTPFLLAAGVGARCLRCWWPWTSCGSPQRGRRRICAGDAPGHEPALDATLRRASRTQGVHCAVSTASRAVSCTCRISCPRNSPHG